MRYALLQTIAFAALLVVANFVLKAEIASQVRQEIDADLMDTADYFKIEFSQTAGLPSRYVTETDPGFLGNFDGFRADTGEVYGPAKSAVFDNLGFATVRETDLFNSDALYVLDIELSDGFPPSAADGTNGKTDSDPPPGVSSAPQLWRVFVVEVKGGRAVAFVPIDEVESALQLIPSIIWPIGLMIMATALVSGLLLGRMQQKRLTKITKGLEKISRGDLTVRLVGTDPWDDLDQLMVKIDETTAKLENSIHQIKHNAQSFAHELRTPLTVLRGELEDASAEVDLTIALQKADEIIRIFDAVQRISRLNNRHGTRDLEELSLVALLPLISDLYEDVAEDEGKTLKTVASSQERILGDQQMLVQLLSNLVENALQYAGPACEITVTAKNRTLLVEDNGPGIPESERSQATKPFFKRNKAVGESGMGLGLALVRAIADYHFATVRLLESPSGGLSVQIVFPKPSLETGTGQPEMP